MTVQTNLQITGVLLIALGLAHGFFNRYFGWTAETQRLTLFTRQVFHVHCFFIAIVLILTGALSTFYADELLRPTPLSRVLLAGLAIFWILRLATQWLVYDSRIWRGSPFLTVMHYLFSGFWIYVAGTYVSAWRAAGNPGLR